MNLSPFLGIAIFIPLLLSMLGFGAFPAARISGSGKGSLFLCISFAAGAAVLSLAGFTLCALHIVSIISAGLIILIGIILFSINTGKFVAAIKSSFAEATGGADRIAVTVLSLVCVVSILSAVPAALAPPIELDALAYHLMLPKLYVAAGGFVQEHTIVYSHYPQAVEMLFMYPLLAGSPVGAALVHFSFALFSALSLIALGGGKTVKGLPAGLAAAALFLATPLVQWEMGASYIDLVPCFYLVLALVLIVRVGDACTKDGALCMAREQNDEVQKETTSINYSVIAFAGIAGGMAVAAKLSSGPYVVFLLLLLLVSSGGGAGRRLKAGVLFSVCCVLPALPWLVKTFVETGNPVYPFMYDVFGARYWNSGIDEIFKQWHFEDYGTGKGIVDFIKLPYNLVFNTAGNYGWKAARPDRGIGYFFLLMLPVLFVPTGDRRVRYLGAFAAAGLLAWFFTSQQLRFLLNFWPALCALYILKIKPSADRNSAAPAVVAVVIAVFFGLIFSQYASNRRTYMQIAFSSPEKKMEMVSQRVPSINALNKFAEITLNDERGGGLLIETRSFYADHFRPVWLTPSQQGVFDYSQIKDGAELRKRLKEYGVEHVLVNTEVFARLAKVVQDQKNAGQPYSEYYHNFFKIYLQMLTTSEEMYSDGPFYIFKL